jgi:hypothetical protein
MKVGDTVRFVGDKEGYVKSFHPVLNRTGEVRSMLDRGRVGVVWKPKTKRGHNEYHSHMTDELQVVEEAQ